jgi:micrococcal nuclease
LHSFFYHLAFILTIPLKKTALLLAFWFLASFQESNTPYKVIGISDGDTIDILVNNKPVRLRLDGIDAPERGMPYNKKAKQFLANQVFGKYVTIKNMGLDKYRRTIAKIYVNNTDINLLMLEKGWAWHYKKHNSETNYANAEHRAKASKLGLWADPQTPMAPWEVRKLHRSGISTKEQFKNSVK